ncbi:XRE family transcriptional regulator [Rhodococcus rhodnii]|uniref:HTH cro/C1-type domain-containing protein n=2 Tax=Rhodococcus rhodnii TaxID=38312 RepID=R7WJS0_9NOCA|nr:helix-turn-helix transcriptional regulator [Rhodococcus rhodnii]EOM75553.1 hypothetical protein Rrhod_3122 [Rhodococcus rhodnii LMG 5362]TXG88268.1 XRE family transcriptional regulator [Rhodococcus rhodnii]TXG88922.1 XRE family transcriptional regulator [Rhodococcus rhodnii]
MELSNRGIGIAVRDLIRSADLTAARVADDIGVPRSTFHRYLHGERAFRADHLIYVAERLDITVRALLEEASTR